MAEAIVSTLVDKISSIIINETNLFRGVGEKFERLEREVIRIQCCLRYADSKHIRDERVQDWLNELCDVAYHIQDSIDMFFLEVKIDRSIYQKHKKIFGKSFKQLKIIRKFAIELNNIHHELQEIFKRRVDYQINLQSLPDKSEAVKRLSDGYENMPYHLKACFLYVALFPKDYEISAKRLIKMWVAEGLISCEEWTTMEARAEAYLEELFARSMIEILCRSMNGSIKRFQVHHLLCDLLMQEARKENFVMVSSQASDVEKPNRRIRRASLQAQERNPQFVEYVGENTRSLLLFAGKRFDNILECSNFRLLRVLELVGDKDNLHNVTSFELISINELIYLKYMGFRYCSIGIFPFSFNRKKNLETLDVRGTGAEVPNDLWTISTLRHVLCDHYSVRGALDGPLSTSDLGNLQTMRWIQPLKTWERELPLLNNLRKLGVCEVEDWVTMTKLLETLPSLISLGIKARQDESLPLDIIYPQAIPNYKNLQSLNLEGKWSNTVTLEACLFPPYLVKLTLTDSQLEQNPMSELGKLKSLKKLCLDRKVLCYSGPTICPEGFPVLHHLKMLDGNIEELTVAQGVMPKLTYLLVHKSTKVHLPPELQHVKVEKW